jgi:hypothetical protein
MAPLLLAAALSADAGIPADATAFGGHRYRVYPFERGTVTWQQARDRCAAQGGHLATITTADEQTMLRRLVGQRFCFLGATDEGHEGTWTWITGESWAYTAWRDGQPNNYADEEHWLATYEDGDWVDVAAEGESFWMPEGYVCEWDAP